MPRRKLRSPAHGMERIGGSGPSGPRTGWEWSHLIKPCLSTGTGGFGLPSPEARISSASIERRVETLPEVLADRPSGPSRLRSARSNLPRPALRSFPLSAGAGDVLAVVATSAVRTSARVQNSSPPVPLRGAGGDVLGSGRCAGLAADFGDNFYRKGYIGRQAWRPCRGAGSHRQRRLRRCWR